MSANLHDRLADLAESAPRATAYDDLWERGRSFGRRRTAAMVGSALACLLILVGAGTLAWPALDQGEVAPAKGGSLGLPDRFFLPSPWLDGTDEAGPIGPLIGVFHSPRNTWSLGSPLSTKPTNGIVGVSAVTGDYRFLDLPDRTASDNPFTDLALSPDGRHLAYWITGETNGQPNARRASETIAGYAVYDTVSGEVVAREVFPTEHGLAGGSLVWVDEDTLELDFNQYQEGWEDGSGYATSGTVWIRDLSQSAARRVPRYWAQLDGSTDSGLVVLRSGLDGFVLMDPEQPDSRRKITLSQPTREQWVLRPDGQVVVGVSAGSDPDNDTGLPKPLIVGDVGSGDRVRLHEVPEFLFNGEIYGWRDDTHLLLRRDGTGTPGDRTKMMSVDIRTGAAEEVARLDAWPELAGGLVDAPVVHATAPPTPMDPRLRLSLSVSGILVGLGGLLALARWRRRVRP